MFNWKALSLVLFVTTTLLFISVILVGVLLGNAKTEPGLVNTTIYNNTISYVNVSVNNNICLSRECINAANMILKNIDTSVDPCDDLFEFACGNFVKNNRIPDDQTSVDAFGELRTTLSNRVADLLESKIGANDTFSTGNAKRYYKSCMNEAGIEKSGEEWFLKVINDEFFGWPILSSSFASTKDVVDMIVQYRLRGARPLVSVTVTSNPKNPAQYVIGIDQPGWFFSKSYYTNANVMDAYKTYLTKMAELMGAETSNPAYKQEIDDMITLEKRFADALLTEAEKRNLTYREHTIPELEAALPQYGLRRIISGIYANVQGITIPDTEKFIVYDWDYLTKAGPIIQDAATNQKKTLFNLLAWSYIKDRTTYLPKRYKEARLDFDKVYNGQTTLAPRSRTCANGALDRLPYAVGRLYVQNYFDENSKTQALEMIENIRTEFRDMLKTQVDWMDTDSKKKADEKADFMDVKIGYPEFTYNNTHLDELYTNYKFDEINFINNNLITSKSDALDTFKKLRDKRNLKDWFSGPAVVNAFYEPELNQICFPAGILQPPFYDGKSPKYLNYGGIGVVIGHEITHGFDDQGRQYDKDGVLYNDDKNGLWSEETIKNYNTRAKCIVDQYSGYLAKQVNEYVNGTQTQGENIADNGGIRESFFAYKKWEAKNGKEPLLPGLSYNQDQLFFINYGQIWCSKFRDATLIQRLKTGVHSPGMFRVIGATSNFDEFAKAFKCKANAANNPAKKCTVW